jgi:hypothetical protein
LISTGGSGGGWTGIEFGTKGLSIEMWKRLHEYCLAAPEYKLITNLGDHLEGAEIFLRQLLRGPSGPEELHCYKH